MEIGVTTYASTAVTSYSRTAASSRAREPRLGFQSPEPDGDAPFTRDRKEPVKVGFGNDSVKIPNLAANTIKRNVRQAGELIPTLEESEARVRKRVEEDAKRLAERDAEPPKRLDIRASQETAVNAARSFISGVNDAAGQARFRTGQAEQPPTNRLDIRIGDAQIPYDKPQPQKPLDLFA
ncbi:MAG: hypothetical protein HUU46_22945 [Candidatus Hydrogenedentes bacterium]|nr:hypothetical protein [Candidatus Hydrogenedentota bacterium]